MIPIVIPLHPKGGKFGNDTEAKYAVRAMQKHVLGGFHLAIASRTLPEWAKGVEWIDDGGQGLKTTLVMAARRFPDGFFWWYDDCILLKDQNPGQLQMTPANAGWGKVTTTWAEWLEKVRARLTEEGLQCFDYSRPHGPYWFTKAMIDEAFEDWPGMAGKFPFETWVLNKRRWPCRHGVVKQYYGGFNGPPPETAVFANFCDDGFTPELQAWLANRLPEPSRFEKVRETREAAEVRGVVLRLKDSPRWEDQCVKECAQHGILLDLFDGVDGWQDDIPVTVDAERFRKNSKRQPRKGEIGCFASNVKFAREAASTPPLHPSKPNWRMLLEDDAIPVGITPQVLLSIAAEAEEAGIGLVLLHTGIKKQRAKGSTRITAGKDGGTWAYMATTDTLAKVAAWKTMSRPIDTALKLSPEFKTGLLHGPVTFGHRNPFTSERSIHRERHKKMVKTARQAVLIVCGKTHGKFVQGIVDYHGKLGDKVLVRHFKDHIDYVGHSLAYVWNGAAEAQANVGRNLKEAGAEVVFCELGWFPQSQFIYFDRSGTNGNSSLFLDPLDWLSEKHFVRLKEAREAYRGGRTLTSGGYVLIPLQLEQDTQIQFWSPFKTMEAFMAHCRETMPDKKLVFRKHPKDPKTYEGASCEGDLLDLICAADMVYGINSTVLLEAALIGKPVVAIGKSLLNIGLSRDHALAALLAKQVPVGESDLDPWLGTAEAPKRVSGFHVYPRQDPKEFEEFCQFVRDRQPESLLEVGSCRGSSLIRLCEAAMPALRRVEVIELPEGPWGSAGSKADLEACCEHLRSRGLEVTLHWVDSCSEEAGEIAAAMEPFDMVFVDANHSLSAVRKDCDRFLPKVNPGGAIAFHDINGKASFKSKGRNMGVPEFWAGIKASRKHLTREFVNPATAFGIGVIEA